MSAGPLTPEQEAALIQEFITITKDAQTVNYAMVATYALLLHDIIITFPAEYRFLWQPKFTKGTAMYLVLRYGNVIVQGIGFAYYLWVDPPFGFCKAWFYNEEWVSDILFIPVTVFLGLRTYALYRGQKFFKWSLIMLVLTSNLGLIASLSAATAQIKFSKFATPGLTCSFTIAAPPVAAGLVQFGSSIFFDFGIFTLTAFRIYQHFISGNAHIARVIFKDCLIYYFFLFFSGLTSLILYLCLPPERAELRGLLINPMRSMAVIVTSRIILNLRRIIMAPGSFRFSTLTIAPTEFETTSLAWAVNPRVIDDGMEDDE